MVNATVDISQTCFHCGENCDGAPVTRHEKSFCCNGCLAVYEILDDNNLCTYYDLDQSPGIRLADSNQRKRFDYLDDPEVISQLSHFSSGHQLGITFYIPNIHCSSCIWLLENFSRLRPGVLSSEVNFLKRELTLLIHSGECSIRSVAETLTDIGYEPEITLNDASGSAANSVAGHRNRKLWTRLAVAGFAFGNIMLLSFPDYLNSSESSLGTEFRLLFGVLNIALSVPVLVYSSTDYLKSAWAAIRQKGVNLDVPISLGIIALYSRSLYEIISGTGPGYLDSFTGLIFFLLIGKIIQQKSFDRLTFDRDYKSYLPLAVNVISGPDDTQGYSVSLNKLKQGMICRLRSDEIVPADALVLNEDTFADYSFITGESEPVHIPVGETIFAGARITGTGAMLQIQEEVRNSYLTRLWNHESFKKDSHDKTLGSFADRISPWFTGGVITIAFISAFYWWQASPEMALSVFTAVLIIACPCALALSTPFTMGSVLNILSLNGLFLKNSTLPEKFAETNHIVFDKTGTLTTNEQSAISEHLNSTGKSELQLIRSACNNSLHPLSRMISAYLPVTDNITAAGFREYPGRGILAVFPTKVIRAGSAAFFEDEGVSIGNTLPDKHGSRVHFAVNTQYAGYIDIRAGIRQDIHDMIRKLSTSFKLSLLSGDKIDASAPFRSVFPADSPIVFEQKPEQKLAYIESLQQKGDTVCMIGDGLNDAGALRQSDFGIALSDDISSFSPACDAIIEGNRLYKLHQFIDFSRDSVQIIKASFALSLIYNLTGLAFAVTGQLSPLVAAILMPLSSVSIMVFTFLSSRYMAKERGLDIWK